MKKSLFILAIILLSAACAPVSPSIQSQELEFEVDAPVITVAPTESEFLADWKIISDKNGITIKQDGDVSRYVFVIDPEVNEITVNQVKGEATFLEGYAYDTSTTADCRFGGARYDITDLHSPVIQRLPLVENGKLIPGTKTVEVPARTLYIDDQTLRISDTASNESLESTKWAITGISADYFIGDLSESDMTILAVKDGQLIIMLATNITIDEIVALYKQNGIDGNDIIVLNENNLQFTCYEGEFSFSHTFVGSLISVSQR